MTEPGHGSLVCALGERRSFFEEVRAKSPLRFLLPKTAGAAAHACLASFGGGLVRGDTLDVSLRVKDGATLLATTQASTKVFRGRTKQVLRAEVDGTLVLLPDPVACFAGARYESEVDVRLGPRGSVLMLDAFSSGRAAYGERWRFERLAARIRVTREGRWLVNDAVVLDQDHGDLESRFGAFEAFATVIALGPRTRELIEALLAPGAGSELYAPSRLHAEDGAFVRILAERPERLIAALRARFDRLTDLLGMDPYASRW